MLKIECYSKSNEYNYVHVNTLTNTFYAIVLKYCTYILESVVLDTVDFTLDICFVNL